jgi:hypothetical protein
MLGHVNSKRATRSLQTTNDEVGDIWVKLQRLYCRSDRHLNILAWSPCDDNLAHMTTSTDVRQGSGNVMEAEWCDRMDRLDMSVVDKLEQFHEKSMPNVSILVLFVIDVDIPRDQSFIDVLSIREVDSSERAIAVERFHR